MGRDKIWEWLSSIQKHRVLTDDEILKAYRPSVDFDTKVRIDHLPYVCPNVAELKYYHTSGYAGYKTVGRFIVQQDLEGHLLPTPDL